MVKDTVPRSPVKPDLKSIGSLTGVRPRLMVFIPAYNAVSTLVRAVASLAANAEPHDIVIFDDGSLVPVSEVLPLTANMIILRSDVNIGPSRGSNVGMDYATDHGYEYMARLDADDVARPERLAVQCKFLDDNPNIGMVGSWGQVVTEDGLPLFVLRHPTEYRDIRRQLYYNSAFLAPSVMFRTSIFSTLGGYDETFLNAEDYELFYRFTRYGGKMKPANIPQVLIDYTMSSHGLSIEHRRQQVALRMRVQWLHGEMRSPHFWAGLLKSIVLWGMPLRLLTKVKVFIDKVSRRA